MREILNRYKDSFSRKVGLSYKKVNRVCESHGPVFIAATDMHTLKRLQNQHIHAMQPSELRRRGYI